VLAKIPVFAANKRKMVVRVNDLLTGSPADGFLKSLAAYCASPRTEETLTCAAEAQKIGVRACAIPLGGKVLQQLESGDTSIKPAAMLRLIDVFENSGALDEAVRAAKCATRLNPDDQALREREKNLLASKYLKDTDLTAAKKSLEMLNNPKQQEALHRSTDPATRTDEMEQRYRQTNSLQDFRELVRALRESPQPRRESAIDVLEDGLQRFGEKETRWFIREIRLERGWAELRLHRKLLEQQSSEQLRREHAMMRQELLRDHVEHLYEVVTALPPSPDRTRRQLELAGRLLEAGRFEEAIKQAQDVKRKPDRRLDALILMAKAFVQLGLTPEAEECFQSILAELNTAGQGSSEKVLEAKYAYAQFLADEAAKTSDADLARQARKLCSDVMVEDIDYRDIRKLAARVDALRKVQQ
jgi:tetratricopeptide (TPR) repeat protein